MAIKKELKLRLEMIKVANLVGRAELSDELYQAIADGVELIRLDVTTPVEVQEPIESVHSEAHDYIEELINIPAPKLIEGE